ncbi:4-hydroxythreonine-4-phosphate dehydrogenase PdxA [Magnetococcales bacterium HHB-1]
MSATHTGWIAITMGDPSGIGPEILLKAFYEQPKSAYQWLYLGDPWILEHTATQLNLPLPKLKEIDPTQEKPQSQATSTLHYHTIPTAIDWKNYHVGKPNAAYGEATAKSIEIATHYALQGDVSAITTLPLHKASLHEAGIHFPGHTELIAHICQVERPVMMLTGAGLRVIPVTIHQSIRTVAESLTKEHLQKTLEIVYQALKVDFAIPDPRIAVAGLNPHAGEAGSFGQAEIDKIIPVCTQLQEQHGWAIRGPLPADTMFHKAARKTYDCAVCMYHDQALIPLKMLAFGEAVNITLGLPIVRTSVDHGTAHDIAGQGIAHPGSLLTAIELAKVVAKNRRSMSDNPH